MEPRSERTVLHRSRGRCRPGARRLTRREKASATPRTPPRSPPGQRGSAALRHVRPSTPTAAHGGRSRPSGTYLPPACVEAMLAAYGPDGARRRLGCVPHARGMRIRLGRANGRRGWATGGCRCERRWRQRERPESRPRVPTASRAGETVLAPKGRDLRRRARDSGRPGGNERCRLLDAFSIVGLDRDLEQVRPLPE